MLTSTLLLSTFLQNKFAATRPATLLFDDMLQITGQNKNEFSPTCKGEKRVESLEKSFEILDVNCSFSLYRTNLINSVAASQPRAAGLTQEKGAKCPLLETCLPYHKDIFE